ncbi:A24 family peptidase [Paraherbaspirillum soli]|uniref:Prepilin peptidase n=1 Tax=Paraherbaspirillum soli TaxID=631222 RepID=A0ABW0MBK8_9BURK
MAHLTPALLADIVLLVLCGLLSAAVWSDIRSHRIPNLLVLSGAALGLALNSVLPEGYGFISALPGALGFWTALAGIGLSVAILLPLYLLRAMGAGDVKLMAMVGAFLGPNAMIGAILLTFILGGVLSLLAALRYGTLGRMLGNVRTMLTSSFFKMTFHQMPTLDGVSASAGKLPYGLAIALGTFAYIALEQAGHMNFLKFFWPY